MFCKYIGPLLPYPPYLCQICVSFPVASFHRVPVRACGQWSGVHNLPQPQKCLGDAKIYQDIPAYTSNWLRTIKILPIFLLSHGQGGLIVLSTTPFLSPSAEGLSIVEQGNTFNILEKATCVYKSLSFSRNWLAYLRLCLTLLSSLSAFDIPDRPCDAGWWYAGSVPRVFYF